MVGDGTWLSVGEAMERFAAAGTPVSDTTVRSYLERGWLVAWYTGGNHARIAPASVDELVPLLKLRPGEERTRKLAELAERNATL